MNNIPVEPEERQRRGRVVRAWMLRAEIDQAVIYGSLSRVWLLAAAPVTFFLIARYLSLEVQGFYFTFASLVALQSFLELGFYIVIMHVASHEWASLEIGPEGWITGDPDALSRLVSLGRLIFKWYAVVSGVFVLIVGSVGFVLFSQRSVGGVDWVGPWFALVVLAALSLWALPFLSLLEGCNQVDTVNRFRLSQAIIGNAALWGTIAIGGGLWAVAVGMAANVLRDVYLLGFRYRRFFAHFVHRPTGPRIDWRTELWPMQWRLGVSGTVNYFANHLINPVMFLYFGAAVAGRTGMTLAAVSGLRSLGAAWMQAKAPKFGMLVARREYPALDRLYTLAVRGSVGIVVLGGFAFWGFVTALDVGGHSFADRVLGPLPTALLLLAAVFGQISVGQSSYLRAHKRDPMVVLSVTSSLAIGLLVWLAGGRYGPTGAAVGYAVVWFLVVVWGHVIWSRCRLAWHSAN